MLSSETHPTSGEAFISSKSLHEAKQLIGYCPQFDGLLDKLTVLEHLEFYCGIKSIATSTIEKTLK